MPADRAKRPSLLTRLSAYLGLGIGVAGIAFVTRLVIQEWDDITEAVSEARPAYLVGAVLLGLLGMTLIGINWLALLRRMKAVVPLSSGFAWYFVGQLGKYVPGGIWPVVGRAELATRAGVTRRAAYTTTATSMFCAYLAAGVTGAALAPAALGAPLPLAVAAALVVLGGVAAVLHPRIIGMVLRVAERVVRRPLLAQTPPWGATLRTLARHIPVWLLVAASTWAVARALSISVDFLLLAAATPLAWLIGFLIIGLPGGLGVRESVFVAFVAPDTTRAHALSIALLSRLVFVAVDITGAAGATLVASLRNRGRPAGSPTEAGSTTPAQPRSTDGSSPEPTISETLTASPVGSPAADR